MSRVRLVVYDDGEGWSIGGSGDTNDIDHNARPYDQRDEAIADALFAARMLRAMGEDAVVYVANSDGLKLVNEDIMAGWQVH